MSLRELKVAILKLCKVNIRDWLVLLLVSFIVGLIYPIAAGLKSTNAISLTLADFIVPVWFILVTSLLIATVIATTTKDRTAGILLASFVSFALWGYQVKINLIETHLAKYLPTIPRHGILYHYIFWVVVIICGVLLYTSAHLLRQKKPHHHKKINGFIITAISFVFIYSIFKLASIMLYAQQQRAYAAPAINLKATSTKSQSDIKKPNIYYIVLDRYTNNNVLKEHFDYDNTQFTDQLRELGYSLDDNAYSTYPYTASSIGSTLDANYLGDIEEQFGQMDKQGLVLLYNLSRYSSVANALKSVGYEYDVIGSWYGVSNKAPLADNFMSQYSLNIGSSQKGLSEFEALQARNNFLGVIFSHTGVLTGYDTAQYITQQLRTLHNYASETNQNGKFIFAHILVPHDPFVFNADGSVREDNIYVNDIGKPRTQKYTDSITFISNEIMEILESIQENSNNSAIIILQSDEGVHPDEMLPNVIATANNGQPGMSNWSDAYLKAKYGILAAYHLPGVSEEEIPKGANSTNIFRLILNHYFNYELPYLPICNFALDKGSDMPFSYTDITYRLNLNPDSRCKTIHD